MNVRYVLGSSHVRLCKGKNIQKSQQILLEIEYTSKNTNSNLRSS